MTVVDVAPPSAPGRALAVVQPREVWSPSLGEDAITVAIAQQTLRDKFMHEVLRKNLDYGTIPGTKKPTLYKPGAERLLVAYGLRSKLLTDPATPAVIDLMGRDHDGEPFVQYQRSCQVFYQSDPDAPRLILAEAAGECNSWEVKYRYRTSSRKCPTCGAEAIRKGAARFGGGWYCNTKAGGCNEKFNIDDPKITDQAVGARTKNPDVADLINTILKIADKRAFVAATIIATGWSDLVTQDLEDRTRRGPDDSEAEEEEGGADDERPAGPPPSGNGNAEPKPLDDRRTALLKVVNGLPSKDRAEFLKSHEYKREAVPNWLWRLTDEQVDAAITDGTPKPAEAAPGVFEAGAAKRQADQVVAEPEPSSAQEAAEPDHGVQQS